MSAAFILAMSDLDLMFALPSSYTYGDLLLIQVCSDPTAVQCHAAFGNCPLLSDAVQKRLTTGLAHYKYT